MYAVWDQTGSGNPDLVENFTVPLYTPNGVALLGSTLYVASIGQIMGYSYATLRFQSGEFNISHPDFVLKLFPSDEALPELEWHGWRYLVGDSRSPTLYMGVGSPCNVPGDVDPYCANTSNTTASNPLYGTIQRLTVDLERNTATMSTVASGMRNTVGLFLMPGRDELFWTDNGRDQWSQDLPPDELNVISNLNETGSGSGAEDPIVASHFGFPFCYGQGIADPQFNPEGDCSPYKDALQALGAHVAALGVAFYPSYNSSVINDTALFWANASRFPDQYADSFFIAEHGSWNAAPPNGYRISRVHYNKTTGLADSYESFLTGFLPSSPQECFEDSDCSGNAVCQINATDYNTSAPSYCSGWGRPVDVLVLPDGSLLLSDDLNGVIYRIYYDDSPLPLPWYQRIGYIVVLVVCSILLAWTIFMWRKVRSLVRYGKSCTHDTPAGRSINVRSFYND